MLFRFALSLIFVFCATLVQADSWELARQDKQRDIRVYVKNIEGSPYQGFYATTRTDAQLATVIAALSDIQAMPEWVNRLRQSRLIKRKANTDIWVHNVYFLPYPFQDREAVLHTVLRQKENGVIEIQSHAVKGLIVNNPKRVRILNMQSTWRLTPEKTGGVKIELWGQGDPGGYLPAVLFNYNVPSGPALTLKFFRQMLVRDKYNEYKKNH